MTSANPKGSWQNGAMLFLIFVSLVMFGTIAYTIAFQDITNLAISTITSVLISVTGILLGLSGLAPMSRSLERTKLQVTLTIATLLWLIAVVMIAQSSSGLLLQFTGPTYVLRSLFLVGIGLFAVLVVMYSTSIVEMTRQRLVVEQAAKESRSENRS